MPIRRAGQVHPAPAVALLAALALAACGASEPGPGARAVPTRDAPLASPEAAQGCPAEVGGTPDRPRVPAPPTTETAGRLVPDADPVEALVCRYAAVPGDAAPLVGGRALEGGLERVRTELLLPQQVPGQDTTCPGTGGRQLPHLLRLRYADGELWLSAVQGACSGTTNGAFTTSVDLGERFARAYDTGTWPR